jgi:hypothetical protein
MSPPNAGSNCASPLCGAIGLTSGYDREEKNGVWTERVSLADWRGPACRQKPALGVGSFHREDLPRGEAASFGVENIMTNGV